MRRIVASHNSSDLKNSYIKAMTNPAGGLTCLPAALNSSKPSWHGGCRVGSQSMQASAGKPQSLTTARKCRQGTGRGGSARGPGAGSGRRRSLAAGPDRRCRGHLALRGARSLVLRQGLQSIRLSSTAGTACAPTPCTQSRSRTTVWSGRPWRSGSGPRSMTVSPGQEHGGTLSTAGPCTRNPVRQAIPGPGAA